MPKTITTSSVRTRFAHNLRIYRVRQGVSQEHLAALAGLSRTFVSDVEREIRNCSIDNIELLAKALKIDVSLLFAPTTEGAELPEPLPKGPRKDRVATKGD